MDGPSYRHKLGPFRQPRTFWLAGGALWWRDEGGGEGRLPFADIKEVRLAYRPSTSLEHLYRTRITPRHGRRIDIINGLYSGLSSFEDLSPGYTAFISELHRRLLDSGVDIAFRKGSTRLAYFGNLLLTVFILAGLAFLLVWGLDHERPWFADEKLGYLLISLPVLYIFMRANRPAHYDPRSLPSDVMPTRE